MNEYSWRINQLDCLPAVGSLINYVNTVHWSYIAARESKEGTINGTISYPEDPENPNFIPFDELTKEKIIFWLESSIDMVSLKDTVDNELDSKFKIINIFNNPFDEL